MKWLFFTIVLINISFFAYNFFYDVQPHKKNVQLKQSDNQQLVLLNELDAAELKALQNKPLAKDISAEVKTDAIVTQTIAKSDDVKLPNEKTDSLEERIDKITQETTQETTPEKKLEKNLCYTIGPFTKKIMDDIRIALEKEYQNQLSFGIETTSAITYYRIYIPPLENKGKIKDTLQLLDDNKLKDHYVMSINGRKNAIALGVFKQRNAAEKVANQAKKIGLSTTIEAISDDKNSLYKLHIIFQQHHETKRYKEILDEMNLKSKECENNS